MGMRTYVLCINVYRLSCMLHDVCALCGIIRVSRCDLTSHSAATVLWDSWLCYVKITRVLRPGIRSRKRSRTRSRYKYSPALLRTCIPFYRALESVRGSSVLPRNLGKNLLLNRQFVSRPDQSIVLSIEKVVARNFRSLFSGGQGFSILEREFSRGQTRQTEREREREREGGRGETILPFCPSASKAVSALMRNARRGAHARASKCRIARYAAYAQAECGVRSLFAIYNRPSISVRVISAAFGMDGRGALC